MEYCVEALTLLNYKGSVFHGAEDFLFLMKTHTALLRTWPHVLPVWLVTQGKPEKAFAPLLFRNSSFFILDTRGAV